MSHEDNLNRISPATRDVGLGTLLQELIDQHNALLAKLDADTGVTGTDYASTLGIADLEDR
ncbi:MAG: hypothetical protein E6Q97_04120 [Desulfurellales bacterium]|nr:MAG: hypothetical protein E6Q97_04120 [Desulfurellales bacterium]